MRRAGLLKFEKNHRGLISFLLWCFVSFYAVADGKYYSWDFSDCDVKDILFAVSIDTGISIVGDDTVYGKGSFKFAGTDFEIAFDSFLNENRLFVTRGEKVWTVSKICVRKDNGLISLDAYDLLPNQIVEKVSTCVDSVLTFESLPNFKMSVHFKELDERSLMESLAKRFGSYEVKQDNVGYCFVKKNDTRRVDISGGTVNVTQEGEGFFVDAKDCSFLEIVERLFSLVKCNGEVKEYCMLVSGDARIQRSVFFGNNFNDTLEVLCSQCGASFVLDDDIFYIFSDVDSKNELINGKKEWRKFKLEFTKSQDFLQFLGKVIGKIDSVCLPDGNSFLALVNEKENAEILKLIKTMDVKQSAYLVNLKYITPAQLMAQLPPSIDRKSLVMSEDSKCIYFYGSLEGYESICKEIELCDKPEKTIKYDLLILQYDETSQNTWSSSFECNRLKAGDRNNISAVLGSVMGFNLNVVTAFGLSFAAELQSSIEESKTKVYADTTLFGISGKQINFQNTNTYRYRDNNVDPETGVPIYSGVTREIISGIKLDVIGNVSGEGLVTSKVTASISRRGTDTSSLTGNPPPTSEKIVTTEVCGRSGEPVILSGLIQNAQTEQQKRTPVISKIPLLGNLFKSKNKTEENSQMIIYLVPHVEGFELPKKEVVIDEVWVELWINKLLESEEVINEK